MSEHFVKLSHGSIYHFCHNSQGICFCNMTDDHIQEYDILMQNGQKDFDVVVDDSDTVHLICQDETGSLIYLKNEEKVWKKYIVMQSKSPMAYQKNFNMQRVGSWLNIIYTIDYKGNKMLSHQIIDHSESPTAVDYITDDFSVAKDELGNIFVLYTNIRGILGWRQYVWSKKVWGDFNAVHVSGKLKNPCIYVDEGIHVAGVMDNSIIYVGNNCEQIIGTSGTSPIFMKVRGSFYVVWENRRDGKVWASLSNDNGLTFQPPTEFVTGRFAPVKKYHVEATSFEGIKSDYCYGFVRDNAVMLYLLNGFFNVSKYPPKPVVTAQQQKDSGVEVTKLKIQIQQLTETVAKLSQKLDAIEKPKQQAE